MYAKRVILILTKYSGPIKRWLGLDRAIAYTVLARGINILGSAGTVLLIVHFLSPIEQGYYYALLSLVTLQTIFELGFSFVVQQLAAHESVHLDFSCNGYVTGDPIAHARLASIFQLTVRWYSRAAAVMALTLLPFGWLFFFVHRHSGDKVAWQGPWMLAAVACSASFFLTPFFSFMDGCGQIRQVARMRLAEASAILIMAWSAMIAHKGLYAPAMAIIGSAAVGLVFLWRRRLLLRDLYRYPPGGHAVSWRNEVWPFQWKIAVSWMCAYFTAQAFIPLLFTLRGPVEAGQMGMSLSITGYLSLLLLSWTSTKATPFGQLIAQGRYRDLDLLFFRTLRQSLALLCLIAFVCMGGVIAIQHIYSRLAVRMVAPGVFALLLGTMICGFVVQSLAIYLRSFKREPFLILYIITAVLTVGMVLLTARRWGTTGAAISYALATGIVGLVFAILIFQRSRHKVSTCQVLVPQSDSARDIALDSEAESKIDDYSSLGQRQHDSSSLLAPFSKKPYISQKGAG
jgi:O-antigen/teichoic acid export membrane protein